MGGHVMRGAETEGAGPGKVTFQRPKDELAGNPRLPEVPGKYLVKYHTEGKTDQIKAQSEPFDVKACPPQGPKAGAAAG
eukprot:531209-Rhodomonas_salina.1